MRVLVIGGGIAGTTAALELASRGAHVTLVEREYYPPYRRHDLPAIAAGAREHYDSFLLSTEALSEAGVTPLFGEAVVALGDGEASLQSGQVVAFDACLVATGTTPTIPGFLLDLPALPRNVFTLASMDEALAVASLVDQGATRVLVYGFRRTALLLSAALAGRPVQVDIVAPGARLLAGDFSPPIARRVASVALSERVAVHAKADVSRLDLSDNYLYGVTLDDGTRLPCHALVIDTPRVPNVPFLPHGIAMPDGVPVDGRQHALRGAVFAAGDVALVELPCGKRRRCATALSAVRQARRAARAVLGEAVGPGAPSPCGFHWRFRGFSALRVGLLDGSHEFLFDRERSALRVATEGRRAIGFEFAGDLDDLEPMLDAAKHELPAVDFSSCLAEPARDFVARLLEPPAVTLPR